MNSYEWVAEVATMRMYWPRMANWAEATTSLYFEDLKEFPADEIKAAITDLRQSGRETAPTGGIIRKAVLQRRQEQGQGAAERQCICHETGGWRRCRARHTEGWMERRSHEVNAIQAAREAGRRGEPLRIEPLDAALAVDLRAAHAHPWEQCGPTSPEDMETWLIDEAKQARRRGLITEEQLGQRIAEIQTEGPFTKMLRQDPDRFAAMAITGTLDAWNDAE